MAKTPQHGGINISISVNQDLSGLVGGRLISGIVADTLERYAKRLESEIKDKWTRKKGWKNATGASWAAWRVKSADGEVVIRNTADYSANVHRAGSRRTVLDSEIIPLIRASVPRFEKEATKQISDYLKKGKV